MLMPVTNTYIYSYVPRLPLPGETVRATRHQNGFGGKGANQAVAAAKLGSKTALISKVSSNSSILYISSILTNISGFSWVMTIGAENIRKI